MITSLFSSYFLTLQAYAILCLLFSCLASEAFSYNHLISLDFLQVYAGSNILCWVFVTWVCYLQALALKCFGQSDQSKAYYFNEHEV